MISKKRLLVYLIVMIFLGVFSTLIAAQEPIKVGLIPPLSGAGAYDGGSIKRGALMAVGEINQAGGIIGRPLELIIEDSESRPEIAVSAMEKLILKDEVSVVIGSFYSSCTKACMPIALRENIPFVNGDSTAPSLTEDPNVNHNWFFRIVPHDGLLAESFSKYAVEELGLKKIALFYEDGEWGRGAAEAFKPALKSFGGEIVLDEIYKMGQTDFVPFVSRFIESNPDAIFIVATSADGAVFMRNLRERDTAGHINILNLGTFNTDVFMELAGEDSEGIYVANAYVDSINTKANTEFVESYKKLYPGLPLPDKHVWGAYTAIYVTAEAIEIAGTDNTTAIRDALEKVSYMGLTGLIEFDEKHQAHPNFYITKNVNGERVLISEVPTK